MRSLSLLFVASLVSASACLVTATPGTTVPREEGPPGPTQGVVEGVVVDAATHQGLARVGIDVALGKQAVGVFTTDDTGHFRLPPMAPGVYAIRVRREQYSQVSLTAVDVHPGENEVNVEMNRAR